MVVITFVFVCDRPGGVRYDGDDGDTYGCVSGPLEVGSRETIRVPHTWVGVTTTTTVHVYVCLGRWW